MRFMEDQRLKGAVDEQFQAFLLQESEKQKFQRLALNLTDICWQLCIGTPASSISSSSRNCIVNCVDRFIDTSHFIAYRLENIVFKNPTELDMQ